MEDELYYERIMIENVLHKVISSIDDASYSIEEKEKYKEEAFKKFLEEAKSYKGCPGFKTMTLDELKEEYKKVLKSINEIEQER